MPGGGTNAGSVIRIGDTIRRPRHDGHEVVEALLVHLENVGFPMAPRFLGVDDGGRQVLEFVEGDAESNPTWQHDDSENARRLGDLAAALRRLHETTASFAAPEGATPKRPLPVVGSVWTHGDPAYANTVYRNGEIVALIDWEFAAPAAAAHDPALLLASEIRGPRPDVDDNDRRALAARLALQAIANGYRLDGAAVAGLPLAAALVLNDAAD